MKLRLYHSSEEQPLSGHPPNEGYDKVEQLLELVAEKGILYETMDTNRLSEEEIQAAYIDACMPSVYKKFKLRQVFGSRRRSGWLFGKGVPALVVYSPESQFAEDVYPHEERGRIVTIKEYLEKLLTQLQ
jgi:hypothetical protein